MTSRDTLLEEFLVSYAAALPPAAIGPEAAAAIGKAYEALRTPGASAAVTPRSLPVCRYLPEAIATARAGAAPVARVAEAFAALEPRLAWAPRAAGGPFASDNWPDGHANAMIVGPQGLEDRRDLSIGVSPKFLRD